MTKTSEEAASPAQPLRSGPVPLYFQLEQDLRARIAAGEFPAGSLLPSEDRICVAYRISRITVRRALDSLARDGLIVRRQGVGSFVAERSEGISSRLTGSLTEFLALAGTLSTRRLSMRDLPPPAEIQSVFGLAPNALATQLRIVGSLEGQPVAYLEIWFPAAIGAQLAKLDFDGRTPVVRLVEHEFKSPLARAEQVVEADHAGKAAARYLGIDPLTPILNVRRIYYARDGEPLEVAYVRYHPQRYRYAIEFRS